MSEAARREQILSAARLVFDEKGYESATVSEIVSAAGVAQGTFYLYFPSKRDVVLALAKRPMELIAERVQASMSSSATFETMIRGLVRTGFEIGREYADLCRLSHMGGEASEITRDTPMGRDIHAMGVRMFEQAIANGEMEPMNAEIAFELFREMLSGTLGRACARGQEERFDEYEQTLTELAVRAFVKS